MIRTISFVTCLSLLGACAAQSHKTVPGTDELAGESNDGDASKADAPHDNFDYLAVYKTGVCDNPITCTPYVLTRVNRAEVMCNDQQYHDSCSVHTISYAGLSQDQQAQIEAALDAAAGDPTQPVQVLIKGQYKIYVDFLVFEASEVWMAQIPGGPTDGVFVRESDTGLRCFGNCAAVLEEKLNSNRSIRINGLDFGASPDPSVQDATWNQERTANGVIVVGERTEGVGEGPGNYTTELRTVDQLFLPVTAAAAPTM